MNQVCIKIINYLAVIFIMSNCNGTKQQNIIEETSSESKIITETIFSKYLNEDRKITMYLPNAYEKENDLQVIYLTDGQVAVSEYKNEMDSLIDNNIIPKVILVGVHSKEDKIEGNIFEYRNCEYMKGLCDDENSILGKLFVNHLKFFTEGVLEFAENKYPVSKNPKKRTFYGFSNGAGFGISMSAEYPLLFKNYICFSMAGEHYENLKWNQNDYPNLVLSCGDQEGINFIESSDEFHQFLNSKGFKHTYYKYSGGHDRKKWKQEFLKTLPTMIK